jgi:hypothetical protein
MVFCVIEGFSETFILDLDVDGFGKVYKYLKRLEARRRVDLAGLYRTGANADKKQYKQFLDMVEVWLPEAERTSQTTKKTQAEFNDLVASGKLR